MYTLEDIFTQATTIKPVVVSEMPNGVSIIRMGVKIQKFKDTIEILNIGKGGAYYQECSLKEYGYFIQYGWVVGCVYLAIDNCLHKLVLIEDRIKLEVNTRKNDKHIKKLKNKRDIVLLKYASYKLKIK